MARVRFIGPEPVTVPELGGRTVEPDEVVEVPDDRFDGYVCQTTNWESVEEPKAGDEAPVAPLKKTAARPQKEG
ncbi:hypothetical protein L0F81_00295 [Streptomyces tricolor]|uniref:Uncharacterized protein n=1 Tax=Streptomyces tricolor TaxID=68277 RepID=A0ABS9J848_9ACTN|nr:hypothetical protein [Streptomyces tricolor]MCG0061739.1 hypothetical protein [Streptomyces tricolor]